MKRRKYHPDNRMPSLNEKDYEEDSLYLNYKESIQEKDLLKKRKKPVAGGME